LDAKVAVLAALENTIARFFGGLGMSVHGRFHTSIFFHRPLAKRSPKNTPRTQMSAHIATHAPNKPKS
jgi:hypothetical protein